MENLRKLELFKTN